MLIGYARVSTGDQLAVARLDRLGRAVLHLIGLGTERWEKIVG